MRKILVIDDDFSTRKKHYLNVFQDKYVLNFTENAKLIFDDISSNKVDIYIIDINLDSFTNPKNNQPLQLHDVLVEIGKSKPIIFISGSYNQLMVEGRLTPIIQNSTEEGYNICSFLYGTKY
ncbi:response regulator [Bacteroides thetaiotaomicron]|nr:response regulator [Bacteroides thetaiotaomicron]